MKFGMNVMRLDTNPHSEFLINYRQQNVIAAMRTFEVGETSTLFNVTSWNCVR
jgi:hypothetical protein